MTSRVWRTESREIWPFAHARAAFDNCALRLDPNEEFDPRRSTFALDEQGLARDLPYELLLRVDARRLRETTEVAAREVDVALVLENDAAKRHEVLKRSSLEELPSRFEGMVPQARSGPRRVRFRLVALLNRERPRSRSGRFAWRVGSVLAERRFSVGPSPDSLFRVHWTAFAEQGWDPRALWYVHARNIDLLCSDADPEEVIQVHLNKDLPALHALWEASATRNQDLSPVAALLRPLMASETLSGLATVVLRQLGHLQGERDDFDPEQIERSSLGAIVLTGLKKGTRLSTAELIRLATDEPELLKMKIQGAIAVGRNYTQATLERLRS